MFYFSDHQGILPAGVLYKEKYIDDEIIFIGGVMTSQIFRHDIKINDVISPSKMSALLIRTKFCDFYKVDRHFKKIMSFTDVVYPWRHWRLPTSKYN